ncbi:Allantoate permease [Rasamsonia emersonii CBS 393.64]|uniref:Allantoate permease n=1 Tax=Rasamsonia emersonii (strain ATCC 16479 / CBS 393.64 / IMI 116815) TaxID=1408163 RepID=A0A0F4YH52_RASE3|nr:Allantoate permease [Rasamsonia emersonii CBS 393.64]KKA17430.1 Allantoate permease [Rasamsonia emersonii CBS 393.64]
MPVCRPPNTSLPTPSSGAPSSPSPPPAPATAACWPCASSSASLRPPSRPPSCSSPRPGTRATRSPSARASGSQATPSAGCSPACWPTESAISTRPSGPGCGCTSSSAAPLSSGGFVLWALLPDSIARARFLTPEERQFAADRVVIAGTGRTENTAWRWDQTRECLLDPKTWHLFAIAILTQIPNGGTQNFSNLVIKSFGFTSLQSTLINIPSSVISTATIAATGWMAGRFRQLNCILIVGVVLCAVAGSSLIYARAHVSKGVQLLGYFLLSPGPSAIPLAMSLVQANYRGVTKKMTMTALMFIAYCAGNIAGPQFFIAAEAPHYNTAFRAILVCYVLTAALALSLRVYLQAVNKKRDREEGVQGSAGVSGAVAGGKVADLKDSDISEAVRTVRLLPEDYDDVTDWKTVGFRYRL